MYIIADEVKKENILSSIDHCNLVEEDDEWLILTLASSFHIDTDELMSRQISIIDRDDEMKNFLFFSSINNQGNA